MIDENILERAAEALAAGEVVALPTDTVYGLAARPDRDDAVDAIFELKGRGRDKALPVLGADVDSLGSVVVLDDRVRDLGALFWPGPLSVVLKRSNAFDRDLGAGRSDSVAVRVPDIDVTRRLLRETGPLAVTSANPSGSSPALTVEDARAMFGDRISVYLDGGPSPGGRASTVISLIGEFSVLREGPISEEELRQKLTP
jgi:L-threonylcarbamoyladenylate synthase